MVDPAKITSLVGAFIRQRREALGLSQRALGQLFEPPVTTQFISNVERGVTPLPPSHVPTLTKTLLISEQDLLALLQKEYSLKLTGKLGKDSTPADGEVQTSAPLHPHIIVAPEDFEYMRKLYDAYKQADPKTKQAFAAICENVLNLVRRPSGTGTPGSEPISE